MRSKVTVVLLFLNVVLFFYIFQFEEKWRAERATLEARRRVLPPEVASMDSFTRSDRAGETVKLEKRPDGSWWLTKPYEWPADGNAVSLIHNELQFLEHDTSFAVADLAKGGQTLADYGLADPALTVAFTSSGKTYKLLIGDDTKTGNRLYVLSPDGERVHVVSRSLAESVGLALGDLRAKTLFTIPAFEVRSLNIQTVVPSNLKVRLRRDAANRWDFESPILARAAKNAVEVTLSALNALNAKNFLDAHAADPDRTGLAAPALRVTLEGNARRETLLIGSPVAAPAEGSKAESIEYYARIEDKSAVFTTTVPTALLGVLRASQETLRDPRVLDFEPANVTSLTIVAPGQSELSLQPLDETAGGERSWQVITRAPGQAPVTAPADRALITELIQKLHLLSAHEPRPGAPRFLSDAPSSSDLENWGFNRPEREISLGLNTGGGPRGNEPSTLTLQVGVSPDKPGEAFARVTNAPFVYQLLPDILDDTPSLARHYRQRLLRELPEGARITSLALVDLATNTPVYSHQLADTDKNWDAALAAEPEARRKALATLLAQLQKLRAQAFTANAFSPDHADTPQGTRPWKYRVDFTLVFGAGPAAQTSSSSLLLTERLGGTTLVAGTAEFGGAVFTVTQDMLDALFALTYTEKHDPGPAVTAPPAPAPATNPAAKP